MTLSMTPPALNLPKLETSEFPVDLRLRDILKTLPRECFRKERQKAWRSVLLSVVTAIAGYVAIVYSPWYLLPFAWFFTGTALTGWFVVGHDCGHRSFANRKWVNDWVGHLAMLPLLYPFHGWRIMHNHHHRHTNKMQEDNAWQPLEPEMYEKIGVLGRWGYRQLRGRLWWLASVVHWIGLHFDWTRVEGKQRQQIRLSALVVIGFAALFFPVMVTTLGWWGLVKFWLMPWLGYHFWMSTFTLVHHTAPHIPFKMPDEWHEAAAQLAGTVHCDYPKWVEVLCHDINVHIPHHISTAIPSYNLRLAHASLKQNWGQYLTEYQFNWSLMQEITSQCHMYHPQTCYQRFADYHRQR